MIPNYKTPIISLSLSIFLCFIHIFLTQQDQQQEEQEHELYIQVLVFSLPLISFFVVTGLRRRAEIYSNKVLVCSLSHSVSHSVSLCCLLLRRFSSLLFTLSDCSRFFIEFCFCSLLFFCFSIYTFLICTKGIEKHKEYKRISTLLIFLLILVFFSLNSHHFSLYTFLFVYFFLT